ncbi:MAG: hypothetical protein HYS09_09415 [Chloroflexi bacterium]|nr:hypothetical protein [Chloroflexota bacterium]
MTTLDEYGPLLRAAFATLHGGHPDEPSEAQSKQPGESLEEFLARTRRETLERLLARMESVAPPAELSDVHGLLVRVLRSAAEADAALAEQMRAYGCGDFQGSIAHSERVQSLVAESARLDRELILALQRLEEGRRGCLEALGLDNLVPPSP